MTGGKTDKHSDIKVRVNPSLGRQVGGQVDRQADGKTDRQTDTTWWFSSVLMFFEV